MPRKITPRLIQFHQEHILETAERLFSEKGIAAATVDDIAKAADCSKSTIYVYFKSKEEIHHHLIYRYMCQLYTGLQACAESHADFKECYFAICDMLVASYEAHPLYFASAMGNLPLDRSSPIYEVGEQINDCMLAIFAKGTDCLRPNLPALPTVFTLWASLGNIILLAHEKEVYLSQRMQMSRSDFMQHGFQLLLSSIVRG